MFCGTAAAPWGGIRAWGGVTRQGGAGSHSSAPTVRVWEPVRVEWGGLRSSFRSMASHRPAPQVLHGPKAIRVLLIDEQIRDDVIFVQ